MKLVIDADIPFIKGVLEPYCEVVYVKGSQIARDDVTDADALIVRTRTLCDRGLLEGSRVRFIATATVGYDHMDMGYCASAEIEIATAAGSNARAVLQWYAAALVSCCNKRNIEPAELAIGVVGTGNTGSLIAKYSAHWGAKVLCCDPPLELTGAAPVAGNRFYSLEELTPVCDIITFHTPLSMAGPDATYHMAGTDFFRALREGAIVMNASRGDVADSSAWLSAIKGGLCSAIIDTWEGEPSPDPFLVEVAELATPHVAGYSLQGKANASAAAVRAVAVRFRLPLIDWFPSDKVRQVTPRMIDWDELRNSIPNYYDIEKESAALKILTGDFENMRNNYRYREEFF